MKKRTNESAQCVNVNRQIAHMHTKTQANLNVNQCIDARRVLSKCVSEIESLGLQKLVVIAVVGFFGVPSPLLTPLLVMVVVVPVVVAVQE
jgi:hypothetical protein